MRIHPVVNISQVVQYRDQVGGQKKVEVKPVECYESKTLEWVNEKNFVLG